MPRVQGIVVEDYNDTGVRLAVGSFGYVRFTEEGLVIVKLIDKDIEKIADIVVEKIKGIKKEVI